MVLDTSALVALLELEPGAPLLQKALARDPNRLVSAATLLETSMVIESRHGEAGGRELDLLLARAQVEIVPVTAEQVALARHAFRKFDKGRHPARLNFGDCFSYALSRLSGEALLYQGEDFSKTDVVSALAEGLASG